MQVPLFTVALGSKFVEGPYGGGNTFIKNFSNYLIKNDHKVVYDLNDEDIDTMQQQIGGEQPDEEPQDEEEN